MQIFTKLPPCPPRELDPCNPCGAFRLEDDLNPPETRNCCSLCQGDEKDNIFSVPRAPGFPNRCILDELTFDQLYTVLLRNPNAKRDLLRITSDPLLISLANEVKLIADPLEDDKIVEKMINGKGTLPFYTQFRGRPDGSIGG